LLTRVMIAAGIGILLLLALCLIYVLNWGDCLDRAACAAGDAIRRPQMTAIVVAVLTMSAAGVVAALLDRPIWHLLLLVVASASLAFGMASGISDLSSGATPGSLWPAVLLLIAPGPVVLIGAAALGLRRVRRTQRG
jgi:hypothetical protein